MELQFPKKVLDHLKRVIWDIKNEEQTQEIKLTDAVPDIGKVLGAWGQILVRGKEWRGSSMAVSGGVMSWVMYAPEDGSEARCVETWIPFQLRWDFPQTEKDGAMRVNCLLKSVDARSVSARKLMVRVVVSAAAEALEPVQTEIYGVGDMPEDVQISTNSYPIKLPREAGEKIFALDEELAPPAVCAQMQKLICYTMEPEITDRKVMADKVVFRGSAWLHCLCSCEGGALRSCDFDLPFSQYAELERIYDPSATADLTPTVTNLELELQENGMLRLKAGLIGQYVIYERPVIEVVEDAYSLSRPLTMQMQEMNLPAVLDTYTEILKAEKEWDSAGKESVDTAFFLAHPSARYAGDGMSFEIPGSFQLLHRDSEGSLQADTLSWQGVFASAVTDDTELLAVSRKAGKPQTGMGAHCDVAVDITACKYTRIPMVTGLELGEMGQPDPNRPSLILRKAGDDSLWSIAKQCGTTVEAIREANALTEAPPADRILLIPVP